MKIETKCLVDEIYNICLELKVYRATENADSIKYNINLNLEDVEFIENLYNTIFLKSKRFEIFNTERVSDVLKKLHEIRLELE